jgi:hypothetical protein
MAVKKPAAKDIQLIGLTREELVWCATALDKVDLSMAGVSPAAQELLKVKLLNRAREAGR